MADLHLSNKEDVFYKLENNSIANIKNILKWADEKGVSTQVTMLDVMVSCGRVKSDKDFKTVLNLVNRTAKKYFVIILRKNMNLFGVLYFVSSYLTILNIRLKWLDYFKQCCIMTV